MRVELSPRNVRRFFVAAIALLFLAHFGVVVGRLTLNLGPLIDLRLMLDFDEEHNLPTLYSSFALMACALLLAAVGELHRREPSDYWPWFGLAAVFVFLSVDEVVQLHEHIDQVRGGALERWRVSGWLLPYLAVAAALAIGYARFLWRLPARHRNWFILAGVIFVGGAGGFELLGPFAQRAGRAYYAACYTCEELFEMTGVAMFALGVIDYAIQRFGSLTVSLRND